MKSGKCNDGVGSVGCLSLRSVRCLVPYDGYVAWIFSPRVLLKLALVAMLATPKSAAIAPLSMPL